MGVINEIRREGIPWADGRRRELRDKTVDFFKNPQIPLHEKESLGAMSTALNLVNNKLAASGTEFSLVALKLREGGFSYHLFCNVEPPKPKKLDGKRGDALAYLRDEIDSFFTINGESTVEWVDRDPYGDLLDVSYWPEIPGQPEVPKTRIHISGEGISDSFALRSAYNPNNAEFVLLRPQVVK